MNNPTRAPSPLHQPAIHESGYRHVSGQAQYVDDIPLVPGTLHGYITTSDHARARLTGWALDRALAQPGVRAILRASDIPGSRSIGPIVGDEELLASDEVHYVGQPIAVVFADRLASAQAAAAEIIVHYDVQPAILSITEAIEHQSYLAPPHVITRGPIDKALAEAPLQLAGEVKTGAQDHFYLETQAALVIPEEAGSLRVISSTQHPTEVQREVAAVAGIGAHRVVCEVPRMGGGFGGKESQATFVACLAALGALHTGRPTKLWLNRERDMRITGKRHPFVGRYRAGFDSQGHILGLRVELFSDAGYSADLSLPVLDRALFHLDNAYFIPAVHWTGLACRTNRPSNTAFRGFGGPQGMVVVEEVINRIAEELSIDPAIVRERNYYGPSPRDRAPYGQRVRFEYNRLARLHTELHQSSDYGARRERIEAFNLQSRWVKRGIGFQPVKFGISFTKSVLNQAGAYVLIYTDGTVQLNHGGTEMGQGLHTKMVAICADTLGVPIESIRVMNTATDKIPNTSATAASCGSDLNGQAVRQASEVLRERLQIVAAPMLGLSESAASTLQLSGGMVIDPLSLRAHSFAEVAQQAWLERRPLAATGYYATPGVGYDHASGTGTPFYYYAYGAAVCEVEVNGLTGEHRVQRVDILHDVGRSLVPTIDRGQIEGGFVQGMGWLTGEEVLSTDDGHPLTLGPSTYKIPAIGDVPLDFRVTLLPRAEQPGVIHGSKAVGEPPLMLAIGVVTALRHAMMSFGAGPMALALPATPEAILRAIHGRMGSTGVTEPLDHSAARVDGSMAASTNV